MLKNILKLNGAQQLSKNEQKSINGGNFGYYLCDADSTVSCKSFRSCAQNSNGEWYCTR